MSPNSMGGVNDLPTDEQIREALLVAIKRRYSTGGIKAFANDAGFPYDRVRDHLTGQSKWTVRAMLEYMQALGLSMTDLITLTGALAKVEGPPD